MSALVIRMLDAWRRPLDDVVDLEVADARTRRVVAARRGVSGRPRLRIPNLSAAQVYQVRVFPLRHRPVGQFVPGPGSKDVPVELFCPVHPQRVREVRFPTYGQLDPALRAVLEQSTLEDPLPPSTEAAGTPGHVLYRLLDAIPKAGLLNLFSKMTRTVLGDDRTTWSFVDDIYRIRGDRFFANVQLAFRDQVKNAVPAGLFHEVPGTLHRPPDGFVLVDSFKTREPFGNLQLTFFATADPPLRFRVDADIDDAQGLEHAFQVLEHWVTRGETHPYDIHQILLFHQRLYPGYELLA
jgi:hypothetical protein